MQYVEITLYKEEPANNIDELLKRLSQLTQIFTQSQAAADWYLTGSSKAEAMKKKLISAGALTHNALELLTKDIEAFPGVTTQIWSENGQVILVDNYFQRDYNKYSYILSCEFENGQEALEFISQSLMSIISGISPHIIQIETNQYSLNRSQVFPDRLPIGWMFYVDKTFDKSELDLGDQMHQLDIDGIPQGTLFVTKRGFFDGKNKDDIGKSNDLEIALAACDILPTYKKIF